MALAKTVKADPVERFRRVTSPVRLMYVVSSLMRGMWVGIDAIWRDVDGAELGAVPDTRRLLSRFATRRASPVSGSVCLRFLDPVGDACFNQMQIPVLVQELRVARNEVSDPALARHLGEILALAESAVGVHTYLWFEGD